MRLLKTATQFGLLIWPFATFAAVADTYIPKAKFFQFSEFAVGSLEYKKMVSDAQMETLIETYPWLIPFPFMVIAFIYFRKKDA